MIIDEKVINLKTNESQVYNVNNKTSTILSTNWRPSTSIYVKMLYSKNNKIVL